MPVFRNKILPYENHICRLSCFYFMDCFDESIKIHGAKPVTVNTKTNTRTATGFKENDLNNYNGLLE